MPTNLLDGAKKVRKMPFPFEDGMKKVRKMSFRITRKIRMQQINYQLKSLLLPTQIITNKKYSTHEKE